MKDKPSILETHPHLEDFIGFLNHLNKESDRGKVLIAATMLDELLLKTIQAFLIKGKSSLKLTEGFNAPLGTFSSRVEIASAMGLISHTEYRELNMIRKIRNEFAHKIGITFKDQRLVDQCNQLHFSVKNYDSVVVDGGSQFTSAATALILNLTNRPHYVGKKRLRPEDWPY